MRMQRLAAALGAIILALTLSVQSFAGCGWIDGLDPRAPADDPGRGILNRNGHHDHIMRFGDAGIGKIVERRMLALRECLPKDTYANLYADVSIRIADAGRRFSGWKDGLDQSAPARDPGRGISSRQAHYNHVATGPGFADVHEIVGERMTALGRTLQRADYAALYADVSVTIAQYSGK